MESHDSMAHLEEKDAEEVDPEPTEEEVIARAQGCLLGQLAGDSLGSLVEFQTPEAIRREYPGGVRELADGGPFDLIAGQPTDDSEMALTLARMLAERGPYSAERTRRGYVRWLESEPFDCGNTIFAGLMDEKDWDSQANGALMRISPLGIFGARHEREQVAQWAGWDAAITHPNPVCRQASSLFASGIALAVRTGCAPSDLYREIMGWAEAMDAEIELTEAIAKAADAAPVDFVTKMGWVLIAMQNALWQLLHCPEPGGGGDRHRHAWRGHRHQRGDLRRPPRCRVRAGCCSRAMAREAARLPAGGGPAGRSPASSKVLLAD